MSIAFDTATYKLANTVQTISFTHTCTGSNLYLVAFVWTENNGDVITGATYNSVTMTLMNKVAITGSAELYCFALAAPTSGANTLTVTASVNTVYDILSASYTGAQQTTTPDNKQTNSATTAASPLNVTYSTTSNNCWGILGMRSLLVSTSAGTNATFRKSDGSGDGRNSGLYDSNGGFTPAGAFSQGVTWSGNNTLGLCGITIAPFVASTGNSNFFAFM
jgi:hypothetical protein